MFAGGVEQDSNLDGERKSAKIVEVATQTIHTYRHTY